MNQKKQTKWNLIFNTVSLIINIGIGIFYTPYLVKSLGILAYGIVPLALIINQYTSIITTSLTGSLTRFYTVAIQTEKNKDASMYLSSSFIAISIIVGCLIPFFVYLIINIDHVFNIPPQFVANSKQLFTFSILGFLISLFTSLFNITLYSQNRLDILNLIKIIRSGISVLLTVYFFKQFSANISYIGYSIFCAEVVVLILSISYFNITASKNIVLSFKLFEKAALSSILSMAIWVMIHQIGDTGLYRIDNLLVNKFWSTRESGILGAITQFGIYVMLTTAVITSLFGPLILISYGKNDHKMVKTLALNNSLLIGILTAIIVGLLSGFSKPILTFWLGAEFSEYNVWFILKQISLPFYAAAGVFAFVYRAWNKVIMPALATLIIGILNLFSSYYFSIISDKNESYIILILLVASIFSILQSFGLNSYSFLKVYPDIPRTKIIGIFFKILSTLIITIIISLSYYVMFNVRNITELSMGLGLVAALVLFIVYFLFLSFDQRNFLSNFILDKFNKKKQF